MNCWERSGRVLIRRPQGRGWGPRWCARETGGAADPIRREPKQQRSASEPAIEQTPLGVYVVWEDEGPHWEVQLASGASIAKRQVEQVTLARDAGIRRVLRAARDPALTDRGPVGAQCRWQGCRNASRRLAEGDAARSGQEQTQASDAADSGRDKQSQADGARGRGVLDRPSCARVRALCTCCVTGTSSTPSV
jgi:hypothetical protein